MKRHALCRSLLGIGWSKRSSKQQQTAKKKKIGCCRPDQHKDKERKAQYRLTDRDCMHAMHAHARGNSNNPAGTHTPPKTHKEGRCDPRNKSPRVRMVTTTRTRAAGSAENQARTKRRCYKAVR